MTKTGSLTRPTGPDMPPEPSNHEPSNHEPSGAGSRRLRQIALGFGLGCLLFGALRLLEMLALHTACEGRTLWALLAPLILGPGGIAFATTNVGKGNGKAALGVGLALSSLFPALAFGVRDIGTLRNQGCAGGYVVFTDINNQKLPQLVLYPGQSVTVKVRPGGFNTPVPDYMPPFVRLKVLTGDAEEGAGVLTTTFGKEQVAPDEETTLTVTASPKAPGQQFTLTVVAAQGPKQADGQLTVTVR